MALGLFWEKMILIAAMHSDRSTEVCLSVAGWNLWITNIRDFPPGARIQKKPLSAMRCYLKTFYSLFLVDSARYCLPHFPSLLDTLYSRGREVDIESLPCRISCPSQNGRACCGSIRAVRQLPQPPIRKTTNRLASRHPRRFDFGALAQPLLITIIILLAILDVVHPYVTPPRMAGF